MNKLLVVNFIGGPGISKSTMAAHVFAELKWENVLVELVSEYAKELTWDRHYNVLKNEYKVFGEQLQRVERLIDQVDVVVSDSPFILPAIYNDRTESLTDCVMYEYNRPHYDMMTVLLRRTKPYVASGRSQTEKEAIEIDNKIQNFLIKQNILYYVIDGSKESVPFLVETITDKLNTIKSNNIIQ